jgi:N6-adenosine-specific RNA methylase IME4
MTCPVHQQGQTARRGRAPAANRRPANGTADPASRPTAKLRPHTHPDTVPALNENDYQALRADIATRGVQTPLEITADGVVLNGVHRLRAASELGIKKVPVNIVATEDEVEHIILAAIHQRQLSASQRAALALELDAYQQLQHEKEARRLANLGHAPGPNAPEVAISPPRGKTREIAACWAGVSPRTIQDAATVREHDPELFERVKDGEIAADKAACRVRRRLRDCMINPLPLPEGPFALIYADPPWQLGNPDGQYAPERHYPTMPLDEITAINVPAADHSVLLLWAVNCLLPQALELINAWGFTYKTNLVWVKPRIGLGNWVRNRHELLLLATRGQVPVPDPDQRPDSVIEAARREHSQKPDEAYRLIETAWPHLSKLELFARTSRPGWAAWGNQLDPSSTASE